MHSIATFVAVVVACVFMVKSHPQLQQQPQADPAPPAAPAADPAPAAPAAGPAPAQAQGRQVSGGAVDPLSAGVETIIGQLKPGFTCDSKVYGYYADPANDCKVFHVCWPITSEHGATINKQWTFVCGNQTLFNQERLVCDRPENVDCSQAASFYNVNDNFGKVNGQ